jgi:hypothetical protein
MTALLDAMGRTIDDLGRTLAALPENERPGKVLIVTMTDGLENQSKTYNLQQIADLIQRQREVYKWEFQFLAANQDAIATASKFNIPATQAISYAPSAAGTRNVMASASRNIRNYAEDFAAPMAAFTPDDRAAAMETAAVPSVPSR